MDEYFAAMPMTNATMLCVGAVTRAETDAAQSDGAEIDGRGYYLFLANEAEPGRPIEILAKFLDEMQASLFARMIYAKTA